MASVNIGDRAPAFSLPASGGKQVRLSDYLGKIVVLYFYPKDNSAVCTAEACSFRDSYEVFQQAGAEVIGVSSDSAQSHDGFAAKNRLPFTLLTDAGGALRKQYGVPKALGLLPGRVTYVIDQQGVVRHIFNSMSNAELHVSEALRVVKQMQETVAA